MGILRVVGVWKGLVESSFIGGEDVGLVVLAWERKSSRNIGFKYSDFDVEAPRGTDISVMSSRLSRRNVGAVTLAAASMSISRCSRS